MRNCRSKNMVQYKENWMTVGYCPCGTSKEISNRNLAQVNVTMPRYGHLECVSRFFVEIVFDAVVLPLDEELKRFVYNIVFVASSRKKSLTNRI